MKVSSVYKIILAIGIICLIVWSMRAFKDFNNESALSSDTYKVSRSDLIQSVTIAGNIVPRRRTVVAAQFNGYVKKLFVKVGEKIKKGDKLVSVVQSLQSSDPVYPLLSPIDGTVVQILADEGEFVKENDSKEYILRIDDLEQLYINSFVPEIDRVKIYPGQEVLIRASAILNKEYHGVVVDAALASKEQDSWKNNSKVEYQVRMKINDQDDLLKPGMSTIIDIVTNKKEKVLIVPYQYVFREKDKSFVRLKSGVKKEVKLGLQNDFGHEVQDGLSEGDQLLRIDFMKVLGGPEGS